MRSISILTVIAVMGLSLTPALAGNESAKGLKSGKGDFLINSKGMSLYVNDKDAGGKSSCYDDCAVKWPPVQADAKSKKSGKFTVLKRKDGTFQWAHNGKPLYTWVNDIKKGDATGDGLNGVWHLARP